MPSIQFGGLSSGLDTKSIIAALMDIERQPLVRLQNQQATFNTMKAAYGDLGSSLTDLLSKAQAFTLTSAGSARTATFGDPTKMTVAASSAAVPGTYQVSVDRLATATRAASTTAIGTAVTDASSTGTMSSLPLAGTVTPGQVGIVVDGKVIKVTIGDPKTTSLQSTMNSIASAIQTQIQASDPSASVTASIVANRLTFSIASASTPHDVRFGVAGDTSNALGVLGLASLGFSDFGTGTATITGTSPLGVVQTTPKLDLAGLTGLASTTTGKITINGVAIAYDTTVDSLTTVLTRINNSSAGVVASIDRTGDKVVLSRKIGGPQAIDIADTTGSLAAALDLAPGTTNAQNLGQSAQVTVDGRTVYSDTNSVTNAVEGLTLNLLDQTVGTKTLTVGVDTNAIQTALGNFVSSYNSLADKLDSLTTHATGQPAAPLEGEGVVEDLSLSIRSMIMKVSSTVTGSLQSLGDLGVNSGMVGSKVGTTTRLQLDTTKLSAALSSNPGGVAQLLGNGGGIMGTLVDRLKALTGFDGLIIASQQGLDASIKANASEQDQTQSRVDAKEAALEAKFAALEATLAQLQSQQAQVTAQSNGFSNSR